QAGGQLLHVGTPPGLSVFQPAQAQRDLVRNAFNMLFTQAAGGKTYVEPADVAKPNMQTLRPYLTLADRDGDGRLTLPELNAALDTLCALLGAPLSVPLSRVPRSWFVLRAAAAAGRLSRIELRTAGAALSARHPPLNDRIAEPGKVEELAIVVHRGPTLA